MVKNLQSLIQLASLCNHQEVVDWVHLELNGYENKEQIPRYRKVSVLQTSQKRKQVKSIWGKPRKKLVESQKDTWGKFDQPIRDILNVLDEGDDTSFWSEKRPTGLIDEWEVRKNNLENIITGLKAVMREYLSKVQKDPENVDFHPLPICNDDKEKLSEEESCLPYLNIPNLPDSFYIALLDEINKVYHTDALLSVQILVRKFFENLIIDILRKKYSAREIELYYDTSKGHFLDFSALLKNLDVKIGDFVGITPVFNSNFIKKINQYREHGNSAAHTLEIQIEKQAIDADAKNLEYLINILIKVLSNIK